MDSTSKQNELTQRFLNAAAHVELALKHRYPDAKLIGLGAAVRYAEKQKHPIVTRNIFALHALTDLRNAIAHSDYRNNMPVAIPREDAVIAFEELAALIENAPQVSSAMSKPVTLAPSASLAVACQIIINQDLSQIPVCDDNDYVGLLTTNALARWVSAAVARGKGDVIEGDIVVADILASAEGYECAAFVKPSYSVTTTCERLMGDNAPVALLVSADGKPSKTIQGILTRFDVPSMMKTLTVAFG